MQVKKDQREQILNEAERLDVEVRAGRMSTFSAFYQLIGYIKGIA